MIDYSDADDMLTFSIFFSGYSFFIIFILALILYSIASSNTKECESMTCEVGQARLLDHECVCVSEPK